MKPKIVCLCGSTRFVEAFRLANMERTLAGEIVLSVGWFKESDGAAIAPTLTALVKERLDMLHLRKIDLADYILVLNVGGYVGTSLAREIGYALATSKTIEFLEPESGDEYLRANDVYLFGLGDQAVRMLGDAEDAQ